MAHGTGITGLVYAAAEGRPLGALEEWAVRCGDCADTGTAEQERGLSGSGTQWRHHAGGTPSGSEGAKA